ncbi:hypothetical protein [Pollutimonas nitritireducens]|nr:hypothetical protein [Pollutimonas nitritireducens]
MKLPSDITDASHHGHTDIQCELGDLLIAEQARWAQVVKKTGFKIN